MDLPCVFVILGPTACGKTALSIELARWLGTEIISADSRQVFREMIIGTARPSDEQMQAVRHHLVGHVSVKEQYNAGRFEQEALECLAGIFRKKQYAVVAGGTGLYIQALCQGLDTIPGGDPDIRKYLQAQFEKHGINWLQDQLKACDPVYYSTADIHNPARLLRAVEVYRISGIPYSSFRKNETPKRPFNILRIGIDMPREELVSRINTRVEEMMQNGLLEEVKALLPFRDLNALNTVGYKELFGYLDGKSSLEEAVENIRVNTRRYAKRQMTWFRKDKEIKWIVSPDLEEAKRIITQYSFPD